MLRGVRRYASPGAKAVRGVVQRNAVEDLVENPPLDGLEVRLRGFQEAQTTCGLSDPAIAIVLETKGREALEPTPVGKPFEFRGRKIQPGRYIPRGVKRRKVPTRPPVLGVRQCDGLCKNSLDARCARSAERHTSELSVL